MSAGCEEKESLQLRIKELAQKEMEALELAKSMGNRLVAKEREVCELQELLLEEMSQKRVLQMEVVQHKLTMDGLKNKFGHGKTAEAITLVQNHPPGQRLQELLDEVSQKRVLQREVERLKLTIDALVDKLEHVATTKATAVARNHPPKQALLQKHMLDEITQKLIFLIEVVQHNLTINALEGKLGHDSVSTATTLAKQTRLTESLSQPKRAMGDKWPAELVAPSHRLMWPQKPEAASTLATFPRPVMVDCVNRLSQPLCHLCDTARPAPPAC